MPLLLLRVQQARLALKGQLAILAQPDRKVFRAFKVFRVSRALLARQGLKAFKEQLDRQAQLARKALRGM